MTSSSLYHVPEKDKWEFDASVMDCFDDMLARSIPQHETMRKAVTDLASSFMLPGGYVVDLGCSRGRQIADFLKVYGASCHYHGIEVSEPMIQSCRDRFKDHQCVTIHNVDLRKDWIPLPMGSVSVVVSVLTVQFIPIEYRLALLAKVYNSLRPGGAFILVEKLLGGSHSIDTLCTEAYYNLKNENGYSLFQIERKRLKLEGVLVPMTADWNADLLKKSGFQQVDTFWLWMNFAGMIAIKSPN